ncbi:ABC transporter permease [Paractinoplanes rhizophilus]|jgi:ABC-2 type transport system permease protein|uniref:ABC transporter permease n=1 Tax=Paractinoplanes rhizophilus TaxID=1416877 RepID=A0ABW2HPQ4_9ACTN|nr:ABC transporter permease [Actinoplanes sp.]
MRAALRAEWTKLRTVPDAAIALPLIALLTAAVSIPAATASSPDVVKSSLLGVQLGQAAVAVWAVHTLAGEYGTGLLRATFTALPRRLDVLLAKAALLLTGVLAAGVPAIVASVLFAHAHADGYPSLGSAAVLRAATGSVLYLCLMTLLALGVAACVRSGVAATGIVLGVLYLTPAVLGMFHDPDWQRWIYRLSPSTAGASIQSTVDLASLPIGPWAGLGVAAAWAFGLFGAGALILRACDV